MSRRGNSIAFPSTRRAVHRSAFAIVGYCRSTILVPGMNRKILLAVILALLPEVLLAQDYQCTIGSLQRRVEILYEGAASVPCEVHYYKDTEAQGERQVLWRALNEEGYCERKAQEFIVQLEDMGWSCERHVAESPPSSADTSDDTESLMPGEIAEPDEDL